MRCHKLLHFHYPDCSPNRFDYSLDSCVSKLSVCKLFRFSRWRFHCLLFGSFVCLSVGLFFCLFVYLYVCLSVCLFVSMNRRFTLNYSRVIYMSLIPIAGLCCLWSRTRHLATRIFAQTIFQIVVCHRIENLYSTKKKFFLWSMSSGRNLVQEVSIRHFSLETAVQFW